MLTQHWVHDSTGFHAEWVDEAGSQAVAHKDDESDESIY